MSNWEDLAEMLLAKARDFKPDEMHAQGLESLAQYVRQKILDDKPVRLNFICTHNSRRSHFGQITAQLLGTYLKIKNLETYSGGTEATAFHTNAVGAVRDLGIPVEKMTDGTNPYYRITTGGVVTEVFSKHYSQEPNPQRNFAAIMVCSSADAGCPVVLGAEKRISLPFEDPKVSDGTGTEAQIYRERALQIGTEIAWAFMRAVARDN